MSQLWWQRCVGSGRGKFLSRSLHRREEKRRGTGCVWWRRAFCVPRQTVPDLDQFRMVGVGMNEETARTRPRSAVCTMNDQQKSGFARSVSVFAVPSSSRGGFVPVRARHEQHTKSRGGKIGHDDQEKSLLSLFSLEQWPTAPPPRCSPPWYHHSMHTRKRCHCP